MQQKSAIEYLSVITIRFQFDMFFCCIARNVMCLILLKCCCLWTSLLQVSSKVSRQITGSSWGTCSCFGYHCCKRRCQWSCRIFRGGNSDLTRTLYCLHVYCVMCHNKNHCSCFVGSFLSRLKVLVGKVVMIHVLPGHKCCNSQPQYSLKKISIYIRAF